jgi:hypothetical protein
LNFEIFVAQSTVGLEKVIFVLHLVLVVSVLGVDGDRSLFCGDWLLYNVLVIKIISANHQLRLRLYELSQR